MADASLPPAAYMCPLTQALIREPLLDPEGNSYEASAIRQWLATHTTSPVTGQPLTPGMLVPHTALAEMIRQWHVTNGSPALGSVVEAPGPRCMVIHMGDGHLTIRTSAEDTLPTDLLLVLDPCPRGPSRETMKSMARKVIRGLDSGDKLAICSGNAILHPLDSNRSAALAAIDMWMGEDFSVPPNGGLGGVCNIIRGVSPFTQSRHMAILWIIRGTPHHATPASPGPSPHEAALGGLRSLPVKIPLHLVTIGSHGHRVDPGLLLELAEEGGGSYTYHHELGSGDSSTRLVAFLLASIKTTIFHHVTVNGQWVGDVRLGGDRHIHVPITSYLRVEARLGTGEPLWLEGPFPPIGPLDGVSHDFQIARETFAQTLMSGTAIDRPEAQAMVSLFGSSLRTRRDVFGPLLTALEGQVERALASDAAFEECGVHLMAALAMAHRDERPTGSSDREDDGTGIYAEEAYAGALWLPLCETIRGRCGRREPLEL